MTDDAPRVPGAAGAADALDVPRVLVISQRAVRHHIAYCNQYAFEDLLCELLGADLYAPPDEASGHRKVWRLTRYVTGSDRAAESAAFYPVRFEPRRDYDLAFVVADNPWQLHAIAGVAGWRERCRVKAAFVSEVWPKMFDNWRLPREPFALYDHFFTCGASSIEPFRAASDRPCHLLPIGVDVETLQPARLGLERPIDVAYVGRRYPDVHAQVADWAHGSGAYYLYDTMKPPLYVADPVEHRSLFTSQMRRTALAFAYPAKSDAVDETGGVQEIGARYFEFAAAGITVVGEAPDNDGFAREFPWADATIDVPRDARGIGETLAGLLEDEPRRRAVERASVCGSLRTHDWAHRFRDILARVGLPAAGPIEARIARLAARADELEGVAGASGRSGPSDAPGVAEHRPRQANS